MVRNNVEMDVKVKCIEAGLTQARVVEKIGTSSPYVNRITKNRMAS